MDGQWIKRCCAKESSSPMKVAKTFYYLEKFCLFFKNLFL